MNKHLTPEKSKLFRNKLAKLIESIYRSRSSIDLQTQEAYVLEAVKILSLYYRNITEANFTPRHAIPGLWPSQDDYNENFEEILDDLLISFAELENIEGVVLEHFNLVAAQSNRLNARIKRLSSAVTDFALYSGLPIKNALFFSDTFSDLSKIEVGSKLLNATECDVNQVEGIVTLPINRTSTTILEVTNTPLLNSNSNGRLGNNEQVGVTQVNSNMSVILDNNPDTWVEYERVLAADDGEPLVLDFTINLGDPSIINFLRVNPNNFGTKTEIEILDISTSVDGNIYLSIKDDIPIAGFTIEDEENVFKLAPSTSKYAGQGLYTFTPRYAKYIRLVLQQSTPYPIQTIQGTQLRYAIGLRDIEIQQQAYEATGEIVSVPFTSAEEIKKITIETNQTPVGSSELAEILHEISVDEGNSWHKIVPLTDDPQLNISSEAVEILNINTEDTGSLSTESPVTSIRYKATLSRDADSFNEGASSFAESIVPFTELKPVPQGDPPSIVLTHRPVTGSLSILDPNFGSRGNISYKYIVGQGKDKPFQLPWTRLPSDLSKTNRLINENSIVSVYVDGVKWDRRPDFENSGPEHNHFILTNSAIGLTSTGSSSAGSLQRLIAGGLTAQNTSVQDNSPIYVEFGDGNKGKKPDDLATIELLFTPERLYPLGKDEHIAQLEFSTSIDKSDVVITRYGNIESATADLSSNSNVHRLPNRNLVNPDSFRFTTPLGGTTVSGFILAERKEFRNGLASPEGELVDSGDWSVDTERGIIYSFDRIDETAGTVSYSYQAQEDLSSAQWDWGDDKSNPSSIKILDDGWITTSASHIVSGGSSKKIDLPNLSIVEGSLEFTVTTTSGVDPGDSPFLKEVPYSGVGMGSPPELSTTVKTEEPVPFTNPAGSIATFSTSTFITENELLGVAFSNTDIFQENVTPASPSQTGEYSVNRSLNTVSVWTGGADLSDAGTIYYYAEDPSKVPEGAYTVDYKRGIIYTQRVIPDTTGIKYEYVDYRARYNVTREIPEVDGDTTNWQLDPSTKTVTLFAPEILNRLSISNVSSNQSFKPLTYQINYKYIDTVRQNIADLEPYFSPILKDFALKIVTKDNI